jgi:integrase
MAAKVRCINGSWWVVVHHQGRRQKKRIGKDKRLATKFAKEIQEKLVRGDLGISEPEDHTDPFKEFAGNWLRSEVELPLARGAAGALAPATAHLHERHLRLYLVPFFGSKDMREIRVTDIQQLYDRCLEKGRPPSERSIEMVVATLRRILAYAEAHEVIERNAVEVWKRSRGRRRRSAAPQVPKDNVLTSEELEAFLGTAQREFSTYYPLFLFLADTGARLGEATALRWQDVDLNPGTARICRSFSGGRYLSPTKTGRERTVELSTRLRDALANRRPDLFGDETLVFPNEAGDLLDPHNFRERVFRRVVRQALGRGRRFTPLGTGHPLEVGTGTRRMGQRQGSARHLRPLSPD